MTVPSRRPSSIQAAAAPACSSAGFTLVELLVGAVLLTIGLSMAASLATISNRSMIRSAQLGNQESLIDSDIAAIRNLAEIYTWCPGSGTTSAAAVSAAGASCASTTPRTEAYYFPNNPVPPNTFAARVIAFENACDPNNNTPTIDELNIALVAAINARAQPPGISRTVANDDIAAHRLRITYAGTNVNRVVVLTPTVAAWCP